MHDIIDIIYKMVGKMKTLKMAEQKNIQMTHKKYINMADDNQITNKTNELLTKFDIYIYTNAKLT